MHIRARYKSGYMSTQFWSRHGLLGKDQHQTVKEEGKRPSSSSHPTPSLSYSLYPPATKDMLRSFGSRELGNHVWYLAVFTNVNIIGMLEFHDVTQHLQILVYNNILSPITMTLLWAGYSNSSIIWHLMTINILHISSSSWLPCPCGRRHNFYCSVMAISCVALHSLQKSLHKPFFSLSKKEGVGWETYAVLL